MTPQEQTELFEDIASLTYLAEAFRDDDGNIISVNFSHHGMFRNRYADGEERPGIHDAAFIELTRLPKLKAVGTQFQPISDRGYYEVFSNLPNLEAIAVLDPVEEAGITHGYVIGANQVAPQLKVLNLKHSFSVKGSALPPLGPFPELLLLQVDVDSADKSVLGLVEWSPRIKTLHLHRTALDDAEFAKLVSLLPDLYYIQIKPSYGLPRGEKINGTSLRHLRSAENLRHLKLSHRGILPLVWDNELEHVAAIPNLETIEYPTQSPREPDGVTPEVTARLQSACPDLKINVRGAQADAGDADPLLGYQWGA